MNRWKLAFRRSVLKQTLAVNAVLAISVGALVSGIFVLTTRRIVIQQVSLRAAETAKLVATRAQFPLLVGDRPELNRVEQETMQLQDVLYVILTDREGAMVRAARDGFHPPGSANPNGARAAGTNWNIFQTTESVDVELPIPRPESRDVLGMDGVTPAAPRPSLGTVRIGLSLKQAREASIVSVMEALGAVAFGLAIILRRQARRLRRELAPLRNLADFTAKIADGQLDRRAEVTGVDEYAGLAVSFNQMLDCLAATLVSKDLAEQANRAKGRFIATASHELRTPLHAIIGYSELLEEECAERGQKEILPDLHKIRSSGRMLLTLVNDLLDYSKAEEGRLQLAPEPVSVAGVIKEVAGIIEPLLKNNENRLIVEGVPDDVEVYADRAKFLQSLLNLASNACKFTQNGTITLGLRDVAEPTGGANRGRRGIRVADTGIGIEPDKIGQLFEAFVQIDSSSTRKHGGTGLGLAVSRKFCRAMGGDITVESEAGRGSTFTIWLPEVDSQGTLPEIFPQESATIAETKDRAGMSE